MTVHAEWHPAHIGLYRTWDRILNLRDDCYFHEMCARASIQLPTTRAIPDLSPAGTLTPSSCQRDLLYLPARAVADRTCGAPPDKRVVAIQVLTVLDCRAFLQPDAEPGPMVQQETPGQ